MKKTYINPTLDIMKIASRAQMLAGSETLQNKDNYGDGTGITLGGRESDLDDDF